MITIKEFWKLEAENGNEYAVQKLKELDDNCVLNETEDKDE